MEPVEKQSVLDLSGIDDDRFFHEAEIQIIEALRVFADTATGSASVRRRLFAGRRYPRRRIDRSSPKKLRHFAHEPTVR